MSATPSLEAGELYELCRRMSRKLRGLSDDEREELAHRVFVRLFEAPRDMRDPASFVFQCLRNAQRSEHRRRKRISTVASDELPHVETSALPEVDVQAVADAQRGAFEALLNWALAQRSSRHRIALQERAEELWGLSQGVPAASLRDLLIGASPELEDDEHAFIRARDRALTQHKRVREALNAALNHFRALEDDRIEIMALVLFRLNRCQRGRSATSKGSDV